MKFIYLGDIMGDLGIKSIDLFLPKITKKYSPDFIIAQGENVDNGKGLSKQKFIYLKEKGINFFTGGNWTLFNKDIYDYLDDPLVPIIRPANYLDNEVGLKYKYLDTSQGKVLIISMLGSIVGKDSGINLNNPLKEIDKILELTKNDPKIAIIVNYHGDYSSEKIVFGHYLDGKVTAVIGDHWHVPTSDYRVLKNKTAYISDVGMIGSLNSSLGVKLDVIYKRWKNELKIKNELEDNDDLQLNGVLIEFNPGTMLAESIIQIKEYLYLG